MKHLLLIIICLGLSIKGFSQAGDDYRFYVGDKICDCWENISIGLDQKTIIQKTDKCMKDGISLYPEWLEADMGINSNLSTAELMQKFYPVLNCGNLYQNLKKIVDSDNSKNENYSYMTRIANENCDCIAQISLALSIEDRKKEIRNCLNTSTENNYSSIKQDYNWNNIDDQKRFLSDLAVEMKIACGKENSKSTNANNSVNSSKKNSKNTIVHEKTTIKNDVFDPFEGRLKGIKIYNYFSFTYHAEHEAEYRVQLNLSRKNYGLLKLDYNYNHTNLRLGYYESASTNKYNEVIINESFDTYATMEKLTSGFLVKASRFDDNKTKVKNETKYKTVDTFIPYKLLDMCLPKGTHTIQVEMYFFKGNGKAATYLKDLPTLEFVYTKK